ncbi:MAG: DNA topoisomerase IV subunit A [Thermodesulfobacteriota bacterium]
MTAEASPQASRLKRLFEKNFVEYSSYVIRDRAIPELEDGLKPVQRRLLHTLYKMDDGRFHKVAGVVGETMKLHPHGDASIYAALVNLANKGFLIDRQGNFGNIYTGDAASAARYIECRLSPLARETLFNPDLTEFVPSYDGRTEEPVALPARLPLLLMQGAEGIAVGMATRILPHNFGELLHAQKAILRGEPFVLYPDFPTGGLVDVAGYDAGNGRVRCRARLEKKDERTIVIREIPYGTTTESLIDSVEKAARAGKIKIGAINDYTAETVEIEIRLARGVSAQDTIPALFAFTDCELAIVPSLTVIRDNTPVILTVTEVLRHNTKKLVQDLERELTIERGRLLDQLQAQTLEQIFIEERLYKGIEESGSLKAALAAIAEGIAPFRERLVREATFEDLERLLEIRIRRISRYDIDKRRREIKATRDEIALVEKKLTDLVGVALTYLDHLLDKYAAAHPRRSEIASFEEVVAREVAPANLTVGYDREHGLLGHGIKAASGEGFPCSEYDRVLLFFRDGRYKVIAAPEKLYVGPDLLWAGRLEEGLIFNLLYRHGTDNLTYAKRFGTPKFILDKEYRMLPEVAGSTVEFFKAGPDCRLRLTLVALRRGKGNQILMDCAELPLRAPAALGKRVSTRVVRRIVEQEDEAPPPAPAPTLFEPPAGD